MIKVKKQQICSKNIDYLARAAHVWPSNAMVTPAAGLKQINQRSLSCFAHKFCSRLAPEKLSKLKVQASISIFREQKCRIKT